ncbi:glycosyltransferase family 4 protein [Salinicoccus roseus]|uniref:glycosyltransferase family 4 protein n=1 Tax=Salinicoccus roseus TaxID=45670 RepID=UPI001EF4A8C1|nr:glycosyltransferase family 4 protein [Salinicoccus roseus]MCG7333062.1 glycosyltransferase family 4 protein [Salinicoccus roseus]
MKVLLVASYPGVSGASKSLITLAEGLKNRGLEVDVLLPGKGQIEGILVEKNINYFVIKHYPWVTNIADANSYKVKLKWFVKKLIIRFNEFRLSRLINEYKYDVIHINALTSDQGANIALKKNIKLVWHVREFLEEGILKTFYNPTKSYKKVNLADAVIGVSDSISEYYSSNIPGIQRIYNGIDVTETTDVKDREKSGTAKLLFINRLVPGKGLEDVLKAAEILKKEKVDFSLNIYGNGSKEYLSKLRRCIDSNNLDENIKFKGFTKDISFAWENADIGIVSSNKEAFGRVTVEGMLYKTFIVGANSGGTKEIIKDQYGMLYNVGSPESLANKLKLIINNKAKREETVKKAYIYAKINFSEDKYINNVLKIYNKILIKSKGF